MIVIFQSATLTPIKTYLSICEKYMLWAHNRNETAEVIRNLLIHHNILNKDQQINIAAWSSEWSVIDDTKRFITRYIVYNDIAKKIGDVIVPLSKYKRSKTTSHPITFFSSATVSTTVPYTIRFT